MQKYVIISHGRSASTLLCEILNNAENVRCYREIFHELPECRCDVNGEIYQDRLDGADFLREKVYVAKNYDAVGFKMFLFHAKSTDLQLNAWKYLYDNKDIKIIYLYRSNLFHSFFSEVKAQITGDWHPENGKSTKNTKIEINPIKAISYIQEICEFQDAERKRLESHDSILLTYEEMRFNLQSNIDRLFNFMDINKYDYSKFKFSSISGHIDESSIKNYEEVRTAFKATPWAWMLA